ncbi:MAG: Hsp20/alpha crystallin family protein [Alphaproteobacteria bacterium]
MDRLFDDFLRALPAVPRLGASSEGAVVPKLDVAETDKEIVVSTELPGIDEKDVDVTLKDGVLTIKGEKKAEKEEKGKNFHRLERSYGAFSRTVVVPADVDEGKVKAGFAKGVLTVTLPKKPGTQTAARKITVKAA